ncbi:low molecular weight phosphatase family protein [uncultured Methylobacterium sp.]|uniref:arsenate-mycothiol transferase ArsC n=1 Tax=uncultured Methylobacterium sp. TaxID=157278 RepID=UPI0035C97F50
MDATAPSPGPIVPKKRRVQSVLFMCNFNAVRSPAAEAIARYYFGKSVYVQSAGVRPGEPTDPFMVAALDEIGIDASKHRPRTIEELEEWEGLNFDLIVTLAPEAHHKALALTHTLAADVEYWPTPDPTILQDASREQRLDAYRDVRDGLTYRIKLRLKG